MTAQNIVVIVAMLKQDSVVVVKFIFRLSHK